MAQKLSDKKLAVLGAGKLGGILLRAYLKQGLFSPKRVTATVKHGEKAAALAKELGVGVTNDNRKAVKDADIILLGVKPQVVGDVLQEIAPELNEKTLVISVAASVPTTYLEEKLGKAAAASGDAEHAVRGGLRHDRDLRGRTRKAGARRDCKIHVRCSWPHGCRG
jgi:pyrroline-5-carboxylate reductase